MSNNDRIVVEVPQGLKSAGVCVCVHTAPSGHAPIHEHKARKPHFLFISHMFLITERDIVLIVIAYDTPGGQAISCLCGFCVVPTGGI